ncbi:MAG: hypothetical protein MK101_03835 [Phycisphaerales bacterium]|nr:hypothetical protein [Phycisphaerales bacterium]
MSSGGTLELAPTACDLGLDVRRALLVVRDAGCPSVQLSVTGPGRLVPRELGSSARRDLASTIRRMELKLRGIDCWVPPDHLLRSDTVDRALAAVLDAIALAGALGHCPVSTMLPEGLDPSVLEALVQGAAQHGVLLADHAPNGATGLAQGVDPAIHMAEGLDPVVAATTCQVARLSDLSQGLRCVPGGAGGRLDVLAYRAALDVSGHTWATLDLRSLMDPKGAIQSTIAIWQDVSQMGQG